MVRHHCCRHRCNRRGRLPASAAPAQFASIRGAHASRGVQTCAAHPSAARFDQRADSLAASLWIGSCPHRGRLAPRRCCAQRARCRSAGMPPPYGEHEGSAATPVTLRVPLNACHPRQLWMVTSYIVDGFADTGTMVGSRLLGEGHAWLMCRLSRVLIGLGLTTGVLAGGLLLALRQLLAAAFSRDPATRLLLTHGPLWPLLCALQPVNSLVFVYEYRHSLPTRRRCPSLCSSSLPCHPHARLCDLQL